METIDRRAIEKALTGDAKGHVRRILDYSFLSHRWPYAYFSSPKCGSTSIKAILWEVEGLPMDGDLPAGPIHERPAGDPRPSLACFEHQHALEKLFGDGTIRFRAWRDPADRLASAFVDKIRVPKNPYYVKMAMRLARDLGYEDGQQIPFEAFVDYVGDQMDADRDIHWMSQRLLTLSDAIEYDHVIRVPHLSDDMADLLLALGVPLPERRVLERKWGVARGPRIDVPPSAAERIRDIYADDYSLPTVGRMRAAST